MIQIAAMLDRLGNEPPLVADGRKGPPDRREVSARWLAGTFLTGFTSVILMGVALSAALDGRQLLATPAEIMAAEELATRDGNASGKSGRLALTALALKISDKRVMQISTLQKVGDRDVVRTLPFGVVEMALGAGHTTKTNYPRFNPTTIFEGANDAGGAGLETGQIYGAMVESEVSLKTVPFPLIGATFEQSANLSLEEVEEALRISGTALTEGDVQIASLHYLDPLRFGNGDGDFALGAELGVKIVQENVSVAPRAANDSALTAFSEEIVPIRADARPKALFADAGYEGADADGMSEAITTLLNAKNLKAGWALRIGIETAQNETRIVRTSIYDGKTHLFTIAIDDLGQYVPTEAPDNGEAVLATLGDSQSPVRVRGELPSVYDGIYRAAFAYDLTPRMAKQLIKMLASEVDFQSRLGPADRLQVFYSIPEGAEKPGETSDILYANVVINGNDRKFYRFRMEDGSIDYFDEKGLSSQQFLLRNPAPNGRLTSGFGMRRHPILGYLRLHAGTDWAGPIGTPILASGNGVVEKAGWTSGYGYQTIIRHANGYETSYSHQSRIAKGIVPGARVRQGQVIGAIGNTGLSTGPHLHYELSVNNVKVDAMRVRLPSGRTLKGSQLAAFKKERDRIDTLMAAPPEAQRVAAAN
jgi:murein DD-endopeptidase MepM/ murein hydrolase activator NlpD